jgi:hypothetical protein
MKPRCALCGQCLKILLCPANGAPRHWLCTSCGAFTAEPASWDVLYARHRRQVHERGEYDERLD